MTWSERALLFAADFHAEPEGGMTVTFGDIPEAITFGADRQDAIAQAAAALDVAVGENLRRGLALPEPSPVGKGQIPIAVDPALARKAAAASRRPR